MGNVCNEKIWEETNVKSPVASLCLLCSSVRNRVNVTMSTFIFSWWRGGASLPFVVAIVDERRNVET